MANITVATWQRRAKHIGRGLKAITGTMVLSTNSSFAASQIEKHFRRCHNIDVNVNTSCTINYMRSATRLYGLLLRMTSNGGSSWTDMCSGTFTATGF